MGQILEHAAEYETVRRLSEMLGSAKEDYKATESYALFATIVCWVMQRARTPANRNDPADVQAREVGIALQGVRISAEPWLVKEIPDMTVFDFFIELRNTIAHGDGRRIKPLNESGILKGQIISIAGNELELRRPDMQRLGSALAGLFCANMSGHETEGNLLDAVGQINPKEEAA